MAFINIILCIILIYCIIGFYLSTPTQSAVVIAFEDTYDLSLLANTLSALNIETTFIIPFDDNNYYEHLVSVEVIKINASFKSSDTNDARAVKLCESFIHDTNILKHKQLLQPTFVIFPAVRHDACLLPWVSSMGSIPVIWARGHYEELYAFLKTGMALPVHEMGFLQSFIENLNLKSFLYTLENNYVAPVQKIIHSKMPEIDTSMTNLYSTTQLVLWGADPILRMNFALLTKLVAEIGCHHCGGSQPLPSTVQKELVGFKTGTIIILLDKEHDLLVKTISQQMEHDVQGLAVLWKNKYVNLHDKPKNLFIHKDLDRQDLIGYPRARMVLCHCTDSEFLESAYHGTPMICFPRTMDEKKNAQRAFELGFAEDIGTTPNIVIDIIKEIHENSKYRENARVVSQAIRDRSNHAMDRILYWLHYVDRHNGEGKNLLIPKRVSTYNEILQAVAGFLIGILFTTLLTILFFMTQQITESQTKKEHKKKYRK